MFFSLDRTNESDRSQGKDAASVVAKNGFDGKQNPERQSMAGIERIKVSGRHSTRIVLDVKLCSCKSY